MVWYGVVWYGMVWYGSPRIPDIQLDRRKRMVDVRDRIPANLLQLGSDGRVARAPGRNVAGAHGLQQTLLRWTFAPWSLASTRLTHLGRYIRMLNIFTIV
jgi:hypothetical protein